MTNLAITGWLHGNSHCSMIVLLPAFNPCLVSGAKKGTRNKPVINCFRQLCICDGIALAEISKYVPPDIAFSKANNQLACMHGDMACHHDQIADDRSKPAAFDFSLLPGSPSADCTLADHTKNVIRNHPMSVS